MRRKSKNLLVQYNKDCAAAGLTYAQMQQKESAALMGHITVPAGYHRAGDWQQLAKKKKRVCYIREGEHCKAEYKSNGVLKKKRLSCKWVV